MSRKTKQNQITTPELLKKVNAENMNLLNDFLTYLKSLQRSPQTLAGYKNDIEIFFVWNLQNNGNKFFIELTKRNIVSYQNWLISTNENSPARIRRVKSALSSFSNYIENVLDDEYVNYRPIIKKIASPINQPVREKSVFTDEDMEKLLTYLTENKYYQKACAVALAMCSGSRKSEITRFKTSYFADENVVYGSVYKTPEKIKTKGRSNGKYLQRYVFKNGFKPYLDLWIEQRKELGINSEWLFVSEDKDGGFVQINPSTLNSWAISFSKVLGMDYYWHALRHYFTTHLSRLGLPDDVIREIIGWESNEMVKTYKDISADEELGKYLDANGIKPVKQSSLSEV